MGTRIDSITKLINDCFKNCLVNGNTIKRIGDEHIGKTSIVEENENNIIVEFTFPNEIVKYNFELCSTSLGNRKKINNVRLIEE